MKIVGQRKSLYKDDNCHTHWIRQDEGAASFTVRAPLTVCIEGFGMTDFIFFLFFSLNFLFCMCPNSHNFLLSSFLSIILCEPRVSKYI